MIHLNFVYICRHPPNSHFELFTFKMIYIFVFVHNVCFKMGEGGMQGGRTRLKKKNIFIYPAI